MRSRAHRPKVYADLLRARRPTKAVVRRIVGSKHARGARFNGWRSPLEIVVPGPPFGPAGSVDHSELTQEGAARHRHRDVGRSTPWCVGRSGERCVWGFGIGQTRRPCISCERFGERGLRATGCSVDLIGIVAARVPDRTPSSPGAGRQRLSTLHRAHRTTDCRRGRLASAGPSSASARSPWVASRRRRHRPSTRTSREPTTRLRAPT